MPEQAEPPEVQAELQRLADEADLGALLTRLIREQPPTPGAVRTALDQLDGTAASAVSLLTGVPREDLNEFGGVPE